MSKICPKCNKEWPDEFTVCPMDQTVLVSDSPQSGGLNMDFGDANAISGGVNINQSKNISSHDTHYHSTIVQERVKSEGEIKLDAANELRAKAQAIMSERGRLDSTAMAELKPLGFKLGVDDDTFKSIIKEVRTNRVGASNGLNAANGRYLLQAQRAVQTNDMDALSNLTPRLEAMAAISQDDSVQYLYYMTLCILYPIKSMEVYEKQTDENYWRTFWAIVSYVRTGKYAEATKMLTQFEPMRYDKSEEDLNLLEAYFHIMQGEKDNAQEFLDEILDEPSSAIHVLLKAIEAKLYEEEPQNLEVRFYYERVMVKSDVVVNTNKNVNQKSADVQDETVRAVNGKEDEQLKENKLEAQALYNKALLLHGKARFELLMLAAEMGLAQAQFEVANALSDDEEREECKMDFIEAVKWYEKAAAQNYAPAHSVLGSIYLHINGAMANQLVTRNYKRGEAELLAAANAGEQMAMKVLCSLYRQEISDEDPAKPEEAFKWSMKCATTYLDEDAQRNLGFMYLLGYGTEENVNQAIHWFKQAASTNDAESMNMLGNIYRTGETVGIDYDKAFEWYEKAAKLGNADAMWNLACAYSHGQGCEIDETLSDKWLHMAAELGCEEAIQIINSKGSDTDEDADSLKNILQEAEEAVSRKDYALAYKKFKEAEGFGYSDASKRIEDIYQEGNNFRHQDNYKDAVTILKPFAEAGHTASMIAWACILIDSKNLRNLNEYTNFSEGVLLFIKASKAGSSVAMVNIGQCYEIGRGVDKNIEKALEWYQKAIDNGYQINDWLTSHINLCKQQSSADSILQEAENAVSRKDYALAFKRFKEAENLGNSNASKRIEEIFNEGYDYYWEQGNCEDAIAILRPFAEAGHIDSMTGLADILADVNDLGNQNKYADFQKGFQWFVKAAEAGGTEGMASVGWCYEWGRGVEKNLDVALEWYQKALDNGYQKDGVSEEIKRCTDLIDIRTKSISLAEECVSKKAYNLAYESFMRAADLGLSDAKNRIEEIYSEAYNYYWEQKNYKDAIAILEPFAEAGHIKSMNSLGSILVDGQNLGNQNVYIDYQKGFHWHMKAAEAGYAFAMSNVGWCYENGRGVEKNLEVALEWYQKALDNGYQKDDWIIEHITNCQVKVSAGEVRIYSAGSEHFFILKKLSLHNISYEECRFTLEVDKLPKWQQFLVFQDNFLCNSDCINVCIRYEANSDNISLATNAMDTFNYVLSVENKEDNSILFQTKGTYCVKRVHHIFKKDEYVIL